MKTKQELFDEMENHLLTDERPSEYFQKIFHEPWFDDYPFYLLKELVNAKQSPKHHPEGNVWNHTMLVLDEAAIRKAKSKNARVFMWAALLHDIGKPESTQIINGKITAYDHDIKGAALTRDFLKEFIMDEKMIDEVTALVRWHMQILHVVNKLPYANIEPMLKQVDLQELSQLGLCDKMGRKNADLSIEESNIRKFIQICQSK